MRVVHLYRCILIDDPFVIVNGTPMNFTQIIADYCSCKEDIGKTEQLTKDSYLPEDSEYEDWGEESVEYNITESAKKQKDKKVKLNKPFRTPKGPKKFAVFVKNDKGNVVKVNFGDPNMEIKRDDPERRKSFRARHNCSNPGPKWKARYWSCKMWSSKKVSDST